MDDGEAEARLARLVRAHHGQVLAYARRRLGDWQAAEDLAAEVFVVAWRRLADVPPEPLPWLYRAARWLLLNEYRKASRRRVAEQRAGERSGPTEDPGVRVTEADRVVRALAALPERDRELLMLIGWEGLTVGQAATVMAVPAPLVSVRLHRARRRLASRLAQSDLDDAVIAPRTALGHRGSA